MCSIHTLSMHSLTAELYLVICIVNESDVLTRKQVAHITEESDALQFIYSVNESDVTVWPEGIPPDGTPLAMTNRLPLGLIVVLYVLAVGAIVFAVACMIFNFVFREKK